jgi:hypothetical protein
MATGSRVVLARADLGRCLASLGASLAYAGALGFLWFALAERWRHQDMLSDTVALAVILGLCLGGVIEGVVLSSNAALGGGATVYAYDGRIVYVGAFGRGVRTREITGVTLVRRGLIGRDHVRISAGRRTLYVPAGLLHDPMNLLRLAEA